MKVKALTVGEIGTNCYILEDEATKLAAVIDPGDEADRIKKLIRQEGVEVKYILCTHGHYDHITGLHHLTELLPDTVEVYIHKADTEMTDRRMFPLSGVTEGYSCYEEGDVLRLGSLTIEVIHTPGHSPGSVTLKVGDCLFVGDTLFAGSVGRTDLGGGSYRALMKSLRKLAELPGDYHVCPGHMGLSTLEQERRTNPYMHEAMRG